MIKIQRSPAYAKAPQQSPVKEDQPLLDRLGIDIGQAPNAAPCARLKDRHSERLPRELLRSRPRTQQRGKQPAPELVDRRTAAKFIGCSVSTLRRLQKDRKLPFYAIGGKHLFDVEDLRQYLERRRVDALW